MSDQHEEVDAVVVEEVGAAVVPGGSNLPAAPPPASGGLANLWATEDPAEIVTKAAKVASALKDVIDKQDLSVRLGGKKPHVEIEGWQTAGTLLGLYAMTTATARVHPMTSFVAKAKRTKYAWADGKRRVVEEETFEYAVEGWSYEAVAEVRTMDGRLVGRGEGICSREEENWFDSSESAVKGMAQTRAQSRALKQTLGFIVGMAGYSSTPAEEVKANGGEEESAPPVAAQTATQDQVDVLFRGLVWLFSDDKPAREAFALVERLGGGSISSQVADIVVAVLGAAKKATAPAGGGDDGNGKTAKKPAPKKREGKEQKQRRERKERADAQDAAAEEGDPAAPDEGDGPSPDPASEEAPDDLPEAGAK
jgi:hypothetical protein